METLMVEPETIRSDLGAVARVRGSRGVKFVRWALRPRAGTSGVPTSRAPIALRPAATALAIVLAAACVFVMEPWSEALIGAVSCALLVIVTVTDIEADRVPNLIVLPALVATLAFQTFRGPSLEWVLAALATGGLLLLAAMSPFNLGMGSVKLGTFVGALLGWNAVVALAIACVAVAAHYGVKVARREVRVTPVPRYIALGAVIVLLAQPSL